MEAALLDVVYYWLEHGLVREDLELLKEPTSLAFCNHRFYLYAHKEKFSILIKDMVIYPELVALLVALAKGKDWAHSGEQNRASVLTGSPHNFTPHVLYQHCHRALSAAAGVR